MARGDTGAQVQVGERHFPPPVSLPYTWKNAGTIHFTKSNYGVQRAMVEKRYWRAKRSPPSRVNAGVFHT